MKRMLTVGLVLWAVLAGGQTRKEEQMLEDAWICYGVECWKDCDEHCDAPTAQLAEKQCYDGTHNSLVGNDVNYVKFRSEPDNRRSSERSPDSLRSKQEGRASAHRANSRTWTFSCPAALRKISEMKLPKKAQKGNLKELEERLMVRFPASLPSKRYEKAMRAKMGRQASNKIYSVDWLGVQGVATRMQVVDNTAYLAVPGYRSKGTLLALRLSHPKPSARPLTVPVYNVVDLCTDSNNTVWALDTGIINTLETPIKLAPPRILAINSTTNQAGKWIELGSLVQEESRLQFLVVEEGGEGVWVYVCDGGAGCLLAWDVSRGRGHRVVLPGAAVPRGGVLSCALLGDTLYLAHTEREGLWRVRTESLRGGPGGLRLVSALPPAVILGADPSRGRLYFRRKNRPEVWLFDSSDLSSRIVFSPKQGLMPTHCPCSASGSVWLIESNFQDYLHRKRKLSGNIAYIQTLSNLTSPSDVFL